MAQSYAKASNHPTLKVKEPLLIRKIVTKNEL